jgi:hypothetical protein
VRIEDPRAEERDGRLERSVRLAWIGGEARFAVRVPAELAPAEEDLSAFVPIAMLLAMRRAEPLQVDGAVSERLLRALPRAQEILHAWAPTLTRIPVRAAAAAPAEAPAAGRASFFSRGVDSTYSAAVERPPEERLSHLVFSRDFDPIYGEETRRRNAEAASAAAEMLGLELVVLSSNIPELLRDVVDFDDATSAMLATFGLSLPGLAGRLLLPSTQPYGTLGHAGSHPLLDGLWSTERVELVHDSCAPDRGAKVGWLVEERPELLPGLHVCFNRDSVVNCGRCGKCLWTMTLLRAAGGLELATSFPDEIDLDTLRGMQRPAYHQWMNWDGAYRTLPPDREHDELRDAIAVLLRKSSRTGGKAGSLSMSAHQTRRVHALTHGRILELPPFEEGTASAELAPLDPAWPPPREVPPGRLGLVRAVDGPEARHRYAAGAVPAGQRSGELGAVLAEPPPNAAELRLDAGGVPLVALERPRRPRPLAAAGWVLAPLRWSDLAERPARLRSSARRALQAGRALLRGRPPARRNGQPAGWLHAEDGPARLPLWAAAHPVLDDVLLTTDEGEARELGYEEPVLLGYLEACAPVTGLLGPGYVDVQWASRWGRRQSGPR